MPWMSRVRVGAAAPASSAIGSVLALGGRHRRKSPHKPVERLPLLLPLVDGYRRVAAPGLARRDVIPDRGRPRDAGAGPDGHVVPDADATAHHYEIANRNTA